MNTGCPAGRPSGGGQQRRVAIARSILIESPWILMDEPSSNPAPKPRIEMRAEIRSNGRRLYEAHDRNEAMLMADQGVVMK